ncbi:MAG: hypothetical protein PHS86_09310 [Syntrophaceae bacterium]|nr:hypothetical protein [Syntrophaceae bacterium]
MDIETLTLIFLIILFLVAEYYRATRSRRGTIVSFEESELGFLINPILTARVQLENGKFVQASVNSCTACMGRLCVGSEVRVYNSSDGYILDVPWLPKKFNRLCG